MNQNNKQRAKDRNFVWIDLEMTGLQPEKDVILEIATIITDSNLDIVAHGPQLVIHHPDDVLKCMNEWVREQHAKSGLLQQVQQSDITVAQAQEQTLTFIKEHCNQDTALLAGNSVWQDRAFLYNYMPQIIAYLHYRLIDVSTVKELVLRWYPEHKQAEFEKKETHRALDDIQESIEELKHYRKRFFV